MRHDGVNASGEAELHGAAHLSTVERGLDERRHNRAECADIEVMAAHILHQLFVDIRIGFFQRLQIRFLVPRRFERGLVAGVEWHAVLDVDAKTRVILLDRLHVIADFAFEADVRHQSAARLGIDARHVARIGVAVRVAVFHIEKNHEVIPIANHISHCPSPPSW